MQWRWPRVFQIGYCQFVLDVDLYAYIIAGEPAPALLLRSVQAEAGGGWDT